MRKCFQITTYSLCTKQYPIPSWVRTALITFSSIFLVHKSESEAVAAVVRERRVLAEGKAAALSLCCWCGFPVGCVPVALLVPVMGHRKVFRGGTAFVPWLWENHTVLGLHGLRDGTLEKKNPFCLVRCIVNDKCHTVPLLFSLFLIRTGS